VFLRSLVEHLAQNPSVSISTLVAPGTTVPATITSVQIRRLAIRRFETFEHVLRLGMDIRRAAPDVFHSPALEPPLRCDRPWVQTLHDVTPMIYDHPDFDRERRRWRAVFARMRKATAIAAVSHYSAETAIRIAGLDPGRVHVVPNGVHPSFAPPAARVESDPPYLLSVGVYGPHKGYAEAFEVVDELARRGHPHRLKVVGTLTPWRRGRIAALLEDRTHADRVDLLGFVPDDELRALYAGATALIVTSRCEGFGLPAVEAMATGTPVVSFSNTALTEVIDGGGALVGDGDVAAMSAELAALIDDRSRWLALSEHGMARAKAFDWNDVAIRYADIYREAGSSG
jgi:glycosyltransferase involved in cell wall biosynthesis